MTRALIVVDVQQDFCEGGSLAVAGGNKVAVDIAEYVRAHGGEYATVVYTKDWHRPWPDTNGGHFSETPDFVDSWPVHCEANAYGSLFHPALEVYDLTKVFYKGYGQPHYSGFSGMNRQGQYLGEYLINCRVREVDVVGIAGDYCVLQTALDAKKSQFDVHILPEMVASVGGPEATAAAVKEIES